MNRLKTAFALFHVYLIVAWSMPPSALRDRLIVPVREYARFLGLDQSWNLFAPVPRRREIELRAELVDAQGGRREWTPPSPTDLRIFSDLRTERYRRWSDFIRSDENRAYWPGFVAYLKRTTSASRVSLIRIWWDVPAPRAGFSHPDRPEKHRVRFFSEEL